MKAINKDIVREIKYTKSRFISILILVALAVAFLSGLKSTAPDMKNTMDEYMDAQNFMDIQILSTLGLTQDDVDAVKAQDSIVDGEGSYQVDVYAYGPDTNIVVKLWSLPERINMLTVKEGRLPEAADECAIDKKITDSLNLKVGDVLSIRLEDSDADDEDYEPSVKYTEFKIVGKVQSPYYVSAERGTSTIGSGSNSAFVYLQPQAFNIDYYTAAYFTVAGADQLTAFSKEYDDLIDDVIDSMEDLAEERADLRYETLVSEANAKLDDAQQELDEASDDADKELGDALNKLTDARKDLNKGWDEYRDGLKEYEEGIADAKQAIADAEIELADGLIKLQDGEKEYADGLAEYEDGKIKYEDGLKEFNDGLRQYNDGAAELDAGQAQLAAAKAQLDAAKAEIEDGEAQIAQYEAALAYAETALTEAQQYVNDIDQHIDEIDAAITALQGQLAGISIGTDSAIYDQYQQIVAAINAWDKEAVDTDALRDQAQAAVDAAAAAKDAAKDQLQDAKDQLADGKAQYEDGLRQYNDGAAQLSAGEYALSQAWSEIQKGRKELDDAKKQLEDAEKELADGRKELDDGWKEYYDGLEELEKGKIELEDAIVDGKQALEDAYKELMDGENKYSDGLGEYRDGKAEADEKIGDARNKLSDARKKIENITGCDWYVLSRSSNPGYLGFGQDADRMGNLANVFPLLFFLVAALVCLTTMTRMVEDQRIQIGSLKALGYSKLSISAKYIAYGALPAAAGGVIGLVLGYILFPTMIFTAYQIMYEVPSLHLRAYAGTSAFSMIAAVSCTTLASLWACFSTLNAVPSELMRPKAPKAGKRVILEYIKPLWSRMSFNSKLTARNLFRYQKRFWMTIIGIGGCTALIIAGFGLRSSLLSTMDRQFDEIFNYNAQLSATSSASTADLTEIEKQINLEDDILDYMPAYVQNVSCESDAYNTTAYMFVVDKEKLSDYVNMRSCGQRQPIYLGDDGVIIGQKLSELLDLQVGDTFTIDCDGRVDVKVASINEHYLGHYIYMSPDYYHKYIGGDARSNSFLLKLSSDDPQLCDSVFNHFMSLSGVGAATRLTDTRDTYFHSMERIDFVVVIVILCAAALAVVVLYNLSNINITERRRELATIKVLGFYDGEVSAYVYRENIVLTIFGILMGFAMGHYLHTWLVKSVEIDLMMFGRETDPMSYLWSGILTAIFSIVVNVMAHYKMKKIDMVESLKSAE